jgi:mono/diheme cytochrome c family protein
VLLVTVELLNGCNQPTLRRNTILKLSASKKAAVVVVVLALLALPLASFAAEAAADVYKAKCAMCHGPDGKGKMAGTKDLASADVQKQSDADLAATITKGKGKMPKYEDKLTADQVKDLVGYIRSLKK